MFAIKELANSEDSGSRGRQPFAQVLVRCTVLREEETGQQLIELAE